MPYDDMAIWRTLGKVHALLHTIQARNHRSSLSRDLIRLGLISSLYPS
jgi:hypothetical protein